MASATSRQSRSRKSCHSVTRTTASAPRTQSMALSARLQAAGARVRAYDPVAEEEARKLIPRGVDFKASALEAGEGADAIVLVTEWPEFADLDWAELAGRMAHPLIVDGRNFLDPGAMRAAGFTYEGIGR